MDIGYALAKGLIQGLTEFLPVSSTAHLIFSDHLLGGWTQGVDPHEAEFFDILLHMGTLGAVIVFFRHELVQVFRAIATNPADPESCDTPSSSCPMKMLGAFGQRFPNWVWFIAISSFITVVLILSALKGSEMMMANMGWTAPNVTDISEYFLAHPQWVALHLFGTGTLMFLVDRQSSRAQPSNQTPGDLSQMTIKQAIAVGAAQSWAAIFHGFSRSGTTISAGLFAGMDRYTATRYTFLLSIPTFIMAMVYESLKIMKLDLSGNLDWMPMILGTVVSGVVGYVCVKLFLRFVANNSLLPFSIYCWIVSAFMLWHFQY